MNKIDLEKFKKITPQMLGEKMAIFWNRFFKLFVILFFLAIVVWSGYLWYFNLYQAAWDDAEKSVFLKTQSNETDLKNDVLTKVLQRTASSQEKFKQEVLAAKNIFKVY